MDGNSPVTPLSKASPFIARRFLHSFVPSVIVLGNWGLFLTGLWEIPVKNNQNQTKKMMPAIAPTRVLHLIKDPNFSDASLCSLHPSSLINMEAWVAKHSPWPSHVLSNGFSSLGWNVRMTEWNADEGLVRSTPSVLSYSVLAVTILCSHKHSEHDLCLCLLTNK